MQEQRGKTLVLKAFKCENTIRAPWVPFSGVHSASLIGADSESYLKSASLIAEGVSKAIELYKADGVPVVFDLQLEAEALGCKLLWAKENPPSVVSHPLSLGVTLEELNIPSANEGRIYIVMEAAKLLRDRHKDIALYGLVTGPFTLALHLMGTDIFMQMLINEEYVRGVLRFCTEVAKTMSHYYTQAGCDVIAVVDPMTSQIGTDHFLSLVKPEMVELFSFLRERDTPSSFFVCGDATHNLEEMARCMPDNISVDENISLELVKEICIERGISFGGNLRLTSTILLGSKEECMADAIDCLDKGGERGYIISPGCDMPYSSKPHNVIAIADTIMDEYTRKVARELKKSLKSTTPQLRLPNYSKEQNVIIDVVTLDSLSCAPCQYMVDAVKRAVERSGGVAVYKEHKIKDINGLAMMRALNVKSIPTICIDGEALFESTIPPLEGLINSITQRWISKHERDGE